MTSRLIGASFTAYAALLIVACSGGGGGSSTLPMNNVQSTPTPTPAPTPTVLILGTGHIAGSDDRFSPVDGDTATGGASQSVDGINCEPMVSTYHVHAHLTLLVNGIRIAIPDAIGVNVPGPETNGYVATGSCFYHLHTHDADGYIHVEAPAVTTFTLGQFFDIWGQPLTTSNVAGFTGATAFYIAQAPTPQYNAVTAGFVPYTGDPRNIALTSHEEIVLEVGPMLVTPPYVPPVEFYTQL